ncbi:uncharacterized protein LOC116193919 [Punica granatum]|uniref:Uncharacterized protein LOC116193919 n=1 Tax=Punica granatum TaxID=22663 RepID=A0A6P8CAC5_PUNGR|nr:uncharacterized protein LOC116193919 [Punica granatum]
MSSMKLFLVLILATALNPTMATQSAALFGTTASLSNNKNNATAYAPPANSIPLIIYELIENSTSPGKSQFEKEIDTLYHGQKPQYGKDYSAVIAIIESFNQAHVGQYPHAVASTVGNKIRINSDCIQDFRGDACHEFTGIMNHESTHVWQWNGNGMAPAGLITGIVDYERLKAGCPSTKWVKRGCGSRWDQGYEITAYFLEF